MKTDTFLHPSTALSTHLALVMESPLLGLAWRLSGKESTCSVGGLGLISGRENPLEEGMAAHSSILAWRIPRSEKPGRLQSVGSQKVRHD